MIGDLRECIDHGDYKRSEVAIIYDNKRYGSDGFDQNAAENARAWRRPRELLELREAVKGIEPHAPPVSVGDVPLLLDRVPEGDALGPDAALEAEIDLVGARYVEARIKVAQQRHDLRRRIGLHRVKDFRQRHVAAQQLVGARDNVEIDHQARRFRLALDEKLADFLAHDHGILGSGSA